MKIKTSRLILLILLLSYSVVNCKLMGVLYYNVEGKVVDIKKIEIKPLDFSNQQGYSNSTTDYFKFYSLDLADDNIDHIFGSFKSQDQVLVAHIFKPKEYKATVFALHGYFNHSGQLNYLIKDLIKQGYAVASYDMQGHGLSTGQKAAIDDFSQYSQTLLDFINLTSPHLKGPYHFIGHSTGAVAVLDYLLTGEANIFDKLILISPLVHCVAWEETKISYRHKIPLITSVPRVFRQSSSDRGYLNFVRHRDPLQFKKVPLKWVNALHQWNEKIAEIKYCNRSIKVIQGKKDTIVDFKFNIKFLQEKFADIDITLIDNGRHELLNESPEIRKKVFSYISHYLETK